jgi:hypothetical protein
VSASEPETRIAIRPARQNGQVVLAAVAVLGAALAFAGFLDLGQNHQTSGRRPSAPATSGTSLIIPVDLSDPGERSHALADLRLPRPEIERLTRLIDADEDVHLGRISIVDTMDPDGDTVRISSLGFQQEVIASNLPQAITVPYRSGADVEVIGIRDGGGGGITVAISTPNGAFPLRMMRPGDVVKVRAP